MELHKAQQEISSDSSRFRVILAGRRFGKTVLAVEEMVFRAVMSENARVAYISPTFQTSRDITWSQLKQRVRGIHPSINESRLEMTLPNKHGGTSMIFLRSWDNVETLRGQYFNFIVLDEVAQFKNFWEGWHEVLRPALTDKKGGAMFISTPLGFNHFYDLYNTNDEDYKSFHFTSYDNPFIDADEINKAKEELTEDRFAQEYLADFRKQEGLVYKEFNRAHHLWDGSKEPEISDKLGGVDFGYVHPTGVLSIKKDKYGIYWVTDELYKAGLTDVQLAEYVVSMGYIKVYPDPARPEAIKELTNRGVNCAEVSKGHDSVANGIQKVREVLKQNRLRVHKQCVNLISEFEMYAYRENTEDPIKEHDHLLDALRYVIMMNEIYTPPRKPKEYRLNLVANRKRNPAR